MRSGYLRALFMIGAGLMGGASAFGAASVYVQPSKTTVAAGDTVTIAVVATNVTDLFAFQVDLTYNASVLTANSVSEGSILLNGGTTYFVPGKINAAAGTITRSADTLQGAIPGVTGSGTLLVASFTAASAGTVTAGIANLVMLDSTLTPIAAASSTFTLFPTTATAGGGPSSASFIVTSSPANGAGAGWLAQSNAAWITLSAGSGSGTGAVSYTLAPNPSAAARTGTISAAGQFLTITQGAAGTCTFSFPSPITNIGNGAGTFFGTQFTGSFVLSASNCSSADTWTAVPNTNRIAMTTPSGNGQTPSATPAFNVFANSSTPVRYMGISVAGQVVTIAQAGSTDPQLNRVVRALYQTILGREPDSAGYTFWTGSGAPKDPVLGGVLVNQMADGFYRSPEFTGSGYEVLSIYQALTGNQPLFNTWISNVTSVRNQSLSTGQLVNNLAGTLSNSAFVQQVITNAWGRSPTPTEQTQFTNQLNADTSQFAKLNFLDGTVFSSPSFQSRTNAQFVTMLYFSILVRDTDAGGLAFWKGQADAAAPGIFYLAPSGSAAYATKLAIIGQAVPPNPNLLGFLGSPEFQGLIQ